MEAGQTDIFSVMSRVEPEPDLDQTHCGSVQLIMQGCRQLWQKEEYGKRERGQDEMKESQRNEGKGRLRRSDSHIYRKQMKDRDIQVMRKVAARGDMHKDRMRGSGGGMQQKG